MWCTLLLDAQPQKLSTINKKKYGLMSFVASHPKILIMIENYASYNIQVF